MSRPGKGLRSVIRVIERVLWALGMLHFAGYRVGRAGSDDASKGVAAFGSKGTSDGSPNLGGLTGSSARSGERRGLPRDRRYGLSAILARIRGWVSQANPVPPQPGREEGRYDRR